MRRRLATLPLFLGLLALAVLVAAPHAFADGGDGSALGKLEPEEIAFLEKNFPEWSKLDPRRKEKIARGVLRVRDLSPEQREKYKARIGQIERGLRDRHPDHRRRPNPLRMADEIGARIQQELPPSVQAQAVGLNVRPSMVRMTLFRMVKGKAVAGLAWDFSEEELASLSERTRPRVERLLAPARAEAESRQRQGARSSLRHVRLSLKFEELHKKHHAEGPKALAEAIAAFWTPHATSVVEEISANPRRFLASVQQMSRYHMDPDDWRKSIWHLERFATREWKGDPQAREAADRVVRNLLITAFKVDRAKAAALPGYDQPGERKLAIVRLIGGKKGAPGKARGRSDRRDGKRRRGGPGGKDKPRKQ